MISSSISELYALRSTGTPRTTDKMALRKAQEGFDESLILILASTQDKDGRHLSQAGTLTNSCGRKEIATQAQVQYGLHTYRCKTDVVNGTGNIVLTSERIFGTKD